MKVLNGHTSPETALVISDYPYGFKLRCKIRYWIETKRGFGCRFCSQTTNPKAGTFINEVTGTTSDVWNKPKYGVYASIVIMVEEDGTGYIVPDALHITASCDSVQRFKAAYYAQLNDDDKAKFAVLEKVSRKYSPNAWMEYDAKTTQTV